jgi:hypothetical protein
MESRSAKGKQEHQSMSTKSQYHGSANPKVQNLRPKKESKSASMKGSAQECESTSAKAQKRVRVQLWQQRL